MSPEALGAPLNLMAHPVSPTVLRVRWDPPTNNHGVAGYRLYYNMHVVPDMDRWWSMETGPFTVMDISGLDLNTVYAVRVRAKSTDGSYGNFSDIAITTKIANGIQSYYLCNLIMLYICMFMFYILYIHVINIHVIYLYYVILLYYVIVLYTLCYLSLQHPNILVILGA
jgi:hypothetical protein